MYRQRVEQLSGKNTPGEIGRQAFDPFDAHAPPHRVLMRTHRRTALEDPIPKAVLAQDVACEYAFPRSQLNYGEVIESGRNLEEVLREEPSDNRIDVR